MSKLSALIADYNSTNLISFLRSKITTFKPDNEDLMYLFDDEAYEKYEVIDKVGEATIENDDLIVICSKTTDPLTEKTGKKRQYDIAKKILKQEVKDAALFVFYDDEGNFRFSFIKANYIDNKRELSSFRRYTYFVSPEKTNKTFIGQIGGCDFNSLEAIINAFSVEPLNKQFYQEIAKGFYSLIGGKVKIGNKNNEFNTQLKLPSTPLEQKKMYQEFGVRLIGRTIFCWFLKSKKSNNGLALIPEEWLSSKTVASNEKSGANYYHAYLEKLFFLTLNKSEEDRIGFDLPDTHRQIPYLNGGLFEAHVDDFFVNGMANYALKIPNQWFLDLFEVLEQYNFTIDENSVNDAEVGIDPEMLGTIFENLLAEIDPDTEKSARKATGSFYTPREIVDYMVEQSLTQYLKTKTGIDDEEKLLNLYIEDGVNPFSDKETNSILEALSEVKILDPACGSGAFPMGALHKIIVALKVLDQGAVWWKERQIKGVNNALARKILKEKLDASNSDYIRKLGVIQNSIYGVDIQPIATEISKLRSFLSLVIDENIDDNAENRGIEPLPNLEFKFVTANTLIGLPEEGGQKGLFDSQEQLEELTNLRVDYLQSSGKKKESIKKKFLKVQKQIFANSSNIFGDPESRAYKLSSWNPFKNETSSWFDTKWMFDIEKFDVVIGNPPYVQLREIDERLARSYECSKYHKVASGGRLNLFQYFISFMLDVCRKEGLVSFIVQNSLMGEKTTINVRDLMLKQKTIISIDSFPERDNIKKRVFEGVKMSVCVGTVLNDNRNDDYQFKINIWEEKQMLHKKKVTYLRSEILKAFPSSIIFPLASTVEKQILFKILNIKNRVNYEIYSGEIDMTKFRPFFTQNSNDLRVIHGAQILKYKITNEPSQGIINYINYKNIPTTGRFPHAKNKRIVMQRITGVDSKVRLVMTIIEANNLCANSTNYIPEQNNLNLKYLLGVLNSKLINYVYKLLSTNTNVTSSDLKRIPIINLDSSVQKIISNHVDNIIDFKTRKNEFDIDVIIYKAYNLTFKEVKMIDPSIKLTEEEYYNFSEKELINE